jgi:hypothetical protein
MTRLLATVCLLLLAACLLVPLVALAQDAGLAEPNPDSIAALTEGAKKVVTDWRTLGTIAGLAALVGFLTQLTKVPVFAAFVPVTVRPWVAAGLGALVGFLDGVRSGGGWIGALISGVIAGAGAIGLSQLASTMTPGGRAKKEAAAAVAQALEGPTAEARAHVEVLKARLDEVAAQPDQTSRLQALAAAAGAASNGVR